MTTVKYSVFEQKRGEFDMKKRKNMEKVMNNFYIASLGDNMYLNFMEFGKKRAFLLVFTSREKIDSYLKAHDFKQFKIIQLDMLQIILLAMSSGTDIIIDRTTDASGCIHVDIEGMERVLQSQAN